MNEETLFHLALEKPPHDRAVFLNGACAGDAELRQRMEVLLQAHEHPGSFLKEPVDEQIATSAFQSDGTPDQSPPTHGIEGQVHVDELSFLAAPTKPGFLGRLGHYEVQEVIGKGGFGIVLKAFDEKLHRIVAIKVLSPAYAAIGSARKRFVREAQSAAAVKNEHVVAIYSVKDEAQPPYLVMELIDGISLQGRLDQKGSLSLTEILRIGLQTAEGLAAAHKQGLVHRDIKPANILLENGVERVRITDFGLARAVDDASMTQSGTVAGTPMYMSPEQAEGLPIDHRSDLFSLGTVLYAMCTGHPPFCASGTHAVLKRVIDAAPRPIREINSEIPDWLCAIIAKLHAKKPDERFQTAKEVAELLGQHLVNVQQSGTAPMPLPEANVNTPEKWRWRAAIIGAALGLISTLFLVFACWDKWFLAADLPPDGVNSIVIPNPRPTFPQLKQTSEPGGWVQLFNGKDLTGWTNPRQAFGPWKVDNGMLIGKGDQAFLRTERGPFGDFHLRMEARYIGTARLLLREQSPDVAGAGYQGMVENTIKGGFNTGGVALMHTKNAMGHFAVPTEVLTQRDQWFTLEVIANGNCLQTFVDGNRAVDFVDIHNEFKEGFIGLMVWGKESELHIKKIEIKEPPPEQRGWIHIFNGTDLNGWNSPQRNKWKVEDGAIIGYGSKGYLGSTDNRFENFHLRLEAMINADGWGGVAFRNTGENHGSVSICPKLGKTGSLFFFSKGNNQRLHQPEKQLASPDTWLNLELIVRGKTAVVLVNGTKTAEARIDGLPERGPIFLNADAPGTVIRFRKIEIKELPSTPAAEP